MWSVYMWSVCGSTCPALSCAALCECACLLDDWRQAVGKRWASLDRLGMVWQTAASHSMSFHVCGDQRRVIVLEMGVWACTLGRWVKGTKNSAFKNPEYRINWGNRITKPALKGGLPTAVIIIVCADAFMCPRVAVLARASVCRY